MIILDTNVLSEPLRRRPDQHVLSWLDCQAPDTLHLTVITLAELWAGVGLLPAGRRRAQLQHALEVDVLPLFDGRILEFGREAARAFGTVHADARAAGNAIDFADCAIAAIASTRRFLVATRNVEGFAGTGVKLVNPWNTAA